MYQVGELTITSWKSWVFVEVFADVLHGHLYIWNEHVVFVRHDKVEPAFDLFVVAVFNVSFGDLFEIPIVGSVRKISGNF